MIDKTLDIFLMVIFGTGGVTILILAWAWAMPLSERIIISSIGSIGLFWVLVRAILLMPLRAKTNIGNKGLAEMKTKRSHLSGR